MGGFPEFCLSSVTLHTRVGTAVAKGTCVTIQWLDNQTKTENPLTLPRNWVGKIFCPGVSASKNGLIEPLLFLNQRF